MNDIEIVKLYFERNDKAITETEKTYGNLCRSIARRILGNIEDTEECVNDTYLRVWNSIPPQKPKSLAAYLGKITRNLSFDRYRKKTAEKRGGTETTIILEELSDITSGKDDTFSELQRKELSKAINKFLDTLKKEHRNIFILRYWYAYSVFEIAWKCGKTESNVSAILSRVRKSMREYLTERGFEI